MYFFKDITRTRQSSTLLGFGVIEREEGNVKIYKEKKGKGEDKQKKGGNGFFYLDLVMKL